MSVYSSPSSCRSRVEPSMSVNRSVTVPCGSDTSERTRSTIAARRFAVPPGRRQALRWVSPFGVERASGVSSRRNAENATLDVRAGRRCRGRRPARRCYRLPSRTRGERPPRPRRVDVDGLPVLPHCEEASRPLHVDPPDVPATGVGRRRSTQRVAARTQYPRLSPLHDIVCTAVSGPACPRRSPVARVRIPYAPLEFSPLSAAA
jgi:hypothetical protein